MLFILNHIGLPSEVGGNIGKPCFDLETLAKNSAYVLEMSSFQLDLTSEIHFRIASLGNITIDHIDRHGSMEEYIKTKNHFVLIKDFIKLHSKSSIKPSKTIKDTKLPKSKPKPR